MAAQPLSTRDPDTISGYRLLGRLGEGGQGTVYLAESEAGDQVAVKLLHAANGRDVLREAATARRVSPFCTARVLETGEEDGAAFVVTEFIDGPTLRVVVEQDGPRQGADLYRLAVGTATALAAIHQAGIVHRDFKPGNVLLGPDGPRVIDFGIARATDATVTASSAVVGTPSYMAPEQLAGETVGPASDVVAWGATTAYAACGRPPYGQDTIPAVMQRIVSGKPDLGALSGPLRELVSECLAKDPHRRPLSRDILLRLLEHTGEPISAPAALKLGRATATASDLSDARTSRWTTLRLPATAEPRGGNPVLITAGAAALTIAVIAGAFVFRGWGDSSSTASTSPAAQNGSARLPSAPRDLAATVDRAMAAKKTASFTARGSMSQSDDQFSANGRLQYRTRVSTDYDMTVRHPDAGHETSWARRLTLRGDTAQFSDENPETVAAVPRSDMDRHVYMAMQARWLSAPYNVTTLLRSTTALRHSTDEGTHTYRGTSTADRLARNPAVASWYEAFGPSKTEFTIVLTNDHLPRRIDIAFITSLGGGESLRSVYSAEYSEWGRSGIITP